MFLLHLLLRLDEPTENWLMILTDCCCYILLPFVFPLAIWMFCQTPFWRAAVRMMHFCQLYLVIVYAVVVVTIYVWKRNEWKILNCESSLIEIKQNKKKVNVAVNWLVQSYDAFHCYFLISNVISFEIFWFNLKSKSKPNEFFYKTIKLVYHSEKRFSTTQQIFSLAFIGKLCV